MVVLPAANFLYSGFNLGDLGPHRLEKTDLPIVVFGLGAQAMRSISEIKLQPGTEQLLRVLSDRCTTIGVRGKYTAQVLEKYSVKNFEVLGCPSNFINNSNALGNEIAARLQKRKQKIALAPTFYSYNSDFEVELYKSFQNGLEQIVCQDPISAVALARGDFDEAQRAWLAEGSGFLAKLPQDKGTDCSLFLGRISRSTLGWRKLSRRRHGRGFPDPWREILAGKPGERPWL